MIAGVDMGSKTTKVIILEDGQILSHSLILTGPNQALLADQCLDEAIKQARISRDQIKRITATGVGMKQATIAHDTIRLSTASRAAYWLFPSARTVLDIGGEEARVTRLDSEGRIEDSVASGRCSAAGGTFVEVMARALEIDLEEFGKLSLRAQKVAPISAQCSVFAESEVVSLIHANVPKEEIAKAIHEAMALRVTSLARQIGIEEDVVLIGGMARNVGFIDSLEKSLQNILIPEEPEFVNALGAALAAAGKLK